MKSFVRDWFDFTRGERSGIIFLVFAIVVMIFFPYFIEVDGGRTDFSRFEKDVEEFYAARQEYNLKNVDRNYNVIDDSQLFYFDPNLAGPEDFEKLGFTEKQIKTILNFRSKGGKFYDADDLGKIYGISPEQFEFLKNYIRINQRPKSQFNGNGYKSRDYQIKKKEMVLVELNSASQEDLMKISGIGPSFAGRIIKYRDMLGGFVNIEQLKEVYGLDEEKFMEIREQVTADRDLITKINFNAATYKDFVKMPYFSKKMARDFIEYVKINGKVKKPEQLVKDGIIDEATLGKISPYISFD